MPRLRWQSLPLCTFLVLFGALISACDSTVAPEMEPRTVDAVEQSCLSSPSGGPDNCTGGESFCYRADGTQTRCTSPGPIDVEMCIDPVTDEQYPCPPSVPRLAFSGATDLEQYLGTIMGAPIEDLIAAEQQHAGFQSLRAYLDAGEATEWGANYWGETDNGTGGEITAIQVDGVTRDDFIASDAFLSILNQKGEIAIGDTVYKVTRDNVYAVSAADAYLLDQKVPTLSSPPPTDGDPRIVVQPVVVTGGENVLYNRTVEPDAPRYNLFGSRSTCEVPAGSNYRMRGTSFITTFGFFSEAVAKTVWERKKTFPWTHWPNRWQSGTLSHTLTASLSHHYIVAPPTQVFTYSKSKSEPRTAKIKSDLTWAVRVGGIVHIKGEIRTTHSVANSSVTGSCSTYASR